jgi:hypothetical protein
MLVQKRIGFQCHRAVDQHRPRGIKWWNSPSLKDDSRSREPSGKEAFINDVTEFIVTKGKTRRDKECWDWDSKCKGKAAHG